MKKKFSMTVAMLLVAASLVLCSSVSFASSTDVTLPVIVRGGQIDVNVTVFNNDNIRRYGATILAVHGLAETAAAWGPLAEELFDACRFERRIKRIVAIDLPGRGKSPIPVGLPGGVKFGELLIDDNMSVIAQVIPQLRDMGMAPNMIMGHSMGGLAIQGLQESLLSQGLSLAHMGIFRAILLAPVPALGSIWNQGPPSDLSAFIQSTDIYGDFFYLPPEYAIGGGGFATTTGEIVPNAPFADIADYNSPEPLYTLLQLTGANPLLPPRPAASAKSFSMVNGTLLNVVSFSEDVLVPADDLDDLYAYLTGSDKKFCYRKVTQDDACHSMFISNPDKVAEVIRSLPFM